MSQISFEHANQIMKQADEEEFEKAKIKYKKRLKRGLKDEMTEEQKAQQLLKNENSVYQELREKFKKDGINKDKVFGIMKFKDFVEMLKLEIQQEEQTKSK